MKFISGTVTYNTLEQNVNAPILRKVFTVTPNEKYVLKIACTGFYRLYLNGENITKGFFAPYIANPNHYVYYDLYDLTNKLNETNVMCILLGNGFQNCNYVEWGLSVAPFRGTPKVAIELIKNDRFIELESNETFEVYDSPITFDDLRAGERYDAHLIDDSIFTLSCKKEHKNAYIVDNPKGELKECKAETVVAYPEEKAVKTIETEDGIVYDFGKCDTGVVRFALNTFDNEVFDLYFGEVFTNNRLSQKNISIKNALELDICQHARVTSKEGYLDYIPTFTFFGFRYVLVKGLPKERASLDVLKLIPVHSDVKLRSNFTSDDQNLNRLQQMVINSDLSNIVYIPMDCPHREKNGWSGDINFSCEQFLYNLDCSNTLREWLLNFFKAQREDGALPCICPGTDWAFKWGNGPAWDAAMFEVVMRLYQFNNDVELISIAYPHFVKYFDYVKTRLNADGLLAFGLGDWLEAGSFSAMGYKTPVEVTDSLVIIDALDKMIYLSKVIGKETSVYEEFRNTLLTNFRNKHLRYGHINCDTQTAQALALHCGAYFEDEIEQARRVLKYEIRRDSNHFKVGALGMKYIFDELVKMGEANLAYEMIFNKTFPSYQYWIDKGFNTLPEAFNYYLEEDGIVERGDTGMLLSFNHHFFGSVSAWFYKYIIGIKVISQDELEISPAFVDKVNYVKTSFTLNNHSINIEYSKENKNVEYKIENDGFKLNINFEKYNQIDFIDSKNLVFNIKVK